MKSELEKQKIKIVDLDVPMNLFRMINGNNTTKKWLTSKYSLWLVRQKYSINTRKTYSKAVKQLLKITSTKNPKLSSRDIEDFLSNKGTVHYSAIRSFLKYIYYEFRKKYIHIEYPRTNKPNKKILKTLSNEDIEKIISDLPIKYRLSATFIYNGALRISEIFRLQSKSINWETWFKDKTRYGLCTIRKTKSNRDRQVPIPPQLMQEVFNSIKNRNNEDMEGQNKIKKDIYMFDYGIEKYMVKGLKKAKKKKQSSFLKYDEKKLLRFREDMIWNKFIANHSRYFELAFRESSIKILGEKAHPHLLRASRATLLLKEGVSLLKIRDLLGHTSVKTTENYLETTIDELLLEIEEKKL